MAHPYDHSVWQPDYAIEVMRKLYGSAVSIGIAAAGAGDYEESLRWFEDASIGDLLS